MTEIISLASVHFIAALLYYYFCILKCGCSEVVQKMVKLWVALLFVHTYVCQIVIVMRQLSSY